MIFIGINFLKKLVMSGCGCKKGQEGQPAPEAGTPVQTEEVKK